MSKITILLNDANGNPITTGQVTGANSLPVVIASDQTSFPVAGTVTANIGTSGSLALDATLTGGTARTKITDGTTNVAVKAASTAAVATDPALVVAISPNNTVSISGTVTANIGTTNGLALDATLTGGTARSKITDGTSNAAVKAASTAAVAADPALVVAVSPNNSVAITAASLPLPTGAATSANQTTLGSQTTKLNDGTTTVAVKAASTAAVAADPALVVAISPNNAVAVSGTVTANIGTSGSLALDATLSAQSLVDNAAFTDGTSRVVPAGYILDETAGTALTENDVAASRIDSKRAQVHVIEDATTRGQRLSVSAAGAAKVDGSGVTQPVSAASLPLPAGAATETTLASRLADSTFTGRINTLGQKTMANSTPVTLASDQSALAVSGTVTANVGTTNGLALDATLTGGTVRTKITDGTTNAAVKAASTAAVAADPALVVAISPNNTIPISAASLPLPAGAATSANQTTLGNQTTKINDGTTTVAVKAASTAAAATDPALVVAISPNNSVAITAASLPLPTGAATSANQTTLGNQTTKINDGTNTMAVKAASTAAAATDAAAVVSLSPNSPISAIATSSFQPDPGSILGAASSITQDASGRLEIHGAVTSDEGSFRDDFAGAALATALTGTVNWTNGSVAVTGSGTTFTTQVKAGQWIKKSADAETAYAVVSSIESDTALTLGTTYTGTTAAGVASVASNWLTVTAATGGSITVSASTVLIVSGTANAQNSYIQRNGDYGPLTAIFNATVSQRIANQTVVVGLRDSFTSPVARAEVQFTGAVNTTATFVTSQDGTLQSTAVTIPSAGTTAAAHSYKIDVSNNQCSLLIDDIIVAQHRLHVPGPYQALNLFAGTSNAAVVTTTTLTVDMASFYNVDRIQTDNDFQSEPASTGGTVPAGQAPAGNPVQIGGSDGTLMRTVATDSLGNVRVNGPNRTRVSIIFQAVATATADTLLSLVKSTNGTAAGGATTIAVAASKTLRITSMTYSVRAGAAAAAFATFTLRINPAGAAVIGSQSEFRVDLGNTEAVIGAARAITIPVYGGIELSGTQQLAVSAAAQATTNILSVTLSGYEY